MTDENRSQPDPQQKQPKNPKKPSLARKLARKLRQPKTLLFLIQLGFNVNKVGKWLLEIELVEELLGLLGL